MALVSGSNLHHKVGRVSRTSILMPLSDGPEGIVFTVIGVLESRGSRPFKEQKSLEQMVRQQSGLSGGEVQT